MNTSATRTARDEGCSTSFARGSASLESPFSGVDVPRMRLVRFSVRSSSGEESSGVMGAKSGDSFLRHATNLALSLSSDSN